MSRRTTPRETPQRFAVARIVPPAAISSRIFSSSTRKKAGLVSSTRPAKPAELAIQSFCGVANVLVVCW